MRLFEIESLTQEIENFPFMKKNFVYKSSTLDFQNKSGIKVAQTYKMPDGFSTEDIYRYISSILRALDSRKIKTQEYKERAGKLYNSILSLNPELKKIVDSSKFENAESHVITAALSRFNVDDIESYVVDGKSGQWYIKQPNYDIRSKMIQEIESLTGAPIHWIMCDKTLKKVYAEAVKKYGKNNNGST